MEDKNWLSFEKSGLVEDYLHYCESSVGRYAEYGAANRERSAGEYGTDLCADGDDTEYDAGGRI